MAKRQIINSTDGNFFAKSFFVIYVLIIIGGLIAGIIILNNSVPSDAIKISGSDDTNSSSRMFDQTTIDNVKKLDGSTSVMPSGRTNPFSE